MVGLCVLCIWEGVWEGRDGMRNFCSFEIAAGGRFEALQLT
jgi:hypothetical protein